MVEPDLAIVYTPELWVEELHRYFTDHGGARVRQLIVDPAIARREEYSILVVSWRWPSLTRGLVEELHEQGRSILGVCDRDEPESNALLTQCGVDRVVTSDAPHHEFLEALVILQSDPVADGVLGPKAKVASMPWDRHELVAIGGPCGTGSTEVAIEFARAAGAVLVDCDELAPALAARLGVPIEPNIRTAIDAVEFGVGDLYESVVQTNDHELRVVCGIPNVASWNQVRAGEAMRCLRSLTLTTRVVADLCGVLEDVGAGSRSRFAVTRAVLQEADVIVAIGASTPVGVIRMLGWIADVHCLRPSAPIHVVMNRAPRDRYRRAELTDEVARTYRPVTMFCAPEDHRVTTAAWNGEVVRRGPFTKAIGGVAAAVLASVGNSASSASVPHELVAS